MRDLSKPLAPTFGGPTKRRKNYSKSVIDATVKSVTRGLGGKLRNLIKKDTQRTMTQDRGKLNKIDRSNDKASIDLSKTRKGERFMPKVMAPKSIKSKPTPKKTLKKKVTVKPKSKKEKRAFNKQGRKIKREVKSELRQEKRKKRKGKRLGKRMMKSVTKKL